MASRTAFTAPLMAPREDFMAPLIAAIARAAGDGASSPGSFSAPWRGRGRPGPRPGPRAYPHADTQQAELTRQPPGETRLPSSRRLSICGPYWEGGGVGALASVCLLSSLSGGRPVSVETGLRPVCVEPNVGRAAAARDAVGRPGRGPAWERKAVAPRPKGRRPRAAARPGRGRAAKRQLVAAAARAGWAFVM